MVMPPKLHDVVVYPQPAKSGRLYFYYKAPPGTKVTIDIFNVMGEKAIVLADETFEENRRTIWNISHVAPGVYLYRVRLDSPGADGWQESGWKKLVVAK
jgi:hypothetical protein